MTSLSDATVTIERGYFETLVRRANFNAEDPLSATRLVSVSHGEYETLRRLALQYANLRQNLLRGGVGEDTIDLLSQDDASIQANEAQAAPPSQPESIDTGRGGAALKPSAPAFQPRFPPQAARDHANGTGCGSNNNFKSFARTFAAQAHAHDAPEGAAEEQHAAENESTSTTNDPLGGLNDHQGCCPQQAPARPQYERQCTRTVLLSNLAEGVVHGDITEAVRGGQLLDVYLRNHERSATVSFLRAADARAFFDHVRRHDLYIKNKRVDIRWNDRQFILPGHVAGKIGIGATRNLVIRRVDPNITEDEIREDLDHIHNLVVIRVEFVGGSCYIRTNSVHNAMFARTCMMSRAKFKGCKIDWDADECCQPWQPRFPAAAAAAAAAAPQPRREGGAPQRKNGGGGGGGGGGGSFVANRFHLLNLEDPDDDDQEAIPSPFRAENVVGITA